MKVNRRFFLTVLAGLAASLSFQSCLFEQEDLFEKSASARLAETLDKARQVLMGAQNGWLMYYYPHEDQIYGGFSYIMKFGKEEVTVWGEKFEGAYTSLYKMTTDSGPVLSFDTSNYAFHYFASPSGSDGWGGNTYGESGKYQAYRADFEFVILSATPEEVLLKGKRSGCHIKMVPMVGDPVEYLDGVNTVHEQIFVSQFDGTIGGEELHVFLDLSNIQATVELGGDKYADLPESERIVKVAYQYTPMGIRFYKPVEVGPYTIETLDWDNATRHLTSAALSADLTGTLPDGWHSYEDFLGEWTLTYSNGSREMTGITITEKEAGKTMLLSGFSEQFDILLTYNLGTGRAQLCSQIVGNDGTYNIRMAGWDSTAGYVTYNDTHGFFMTFGPPGEGAEDDASTIFFTDNRQWLSYTVRSLILYRFSGTTRIGSALTPWFFRTGNHQLSTPSKLTRAN